MAFATWYLEEQNSERGFLEDSFLSVRWMTVTLAAEAYKHLISIPTESTPSTPSGSNSGGAFTWFD